MSTGLQDSVSFTPQSDFQDEVPGSANYAPTQSKFALGEKREQRERATKLSERGMQVRSELEGYPVGEVTRGIWTAAWIASWTYT